VEETFERYWKACEEGLDAFWGIERESKKARKLAQQAQAQAQAQESSQAQSQTALARGAGMNKEEGAKGKGKGKGAGKGVGMFALLAGMEEEED